MFTNVLQIEKQAKKEIEALYDNLVNLILSLPFVKIYIANGDPIPINEYAFYTAMQTQVDKIVNKWLTNMRYTIEKHIDNSWVLSESIFQKTLKKLVPKKIYSFLDNRGMFKHNINRLNEFKNLRVGKLRLSDRVWKLEKGVVSNIETGLQIGLYEGKSAVQLTKQVRQFLYEPKKLFRRVRDLQGKLKLSTNALNYNPGRGVYRSSYKNALRLTSDQINKAYRLADYDKCQQNDFIVGIEIELSNNHTINGIQFHDICDELAGKYPKDFKWTGWHVKCRCNKKTVLKSWEEMELDSQLIDDGLEPLNESSNTVKSYPKSMNSWIKKNKKRYKPGKVDWIDDNSHVLTIINH